MRQPQRLGWRRFLVQLHLWLGLALGLYVVFISVTGSLSVLRADVHGWFVPRTVAMDGPRLAGDALHEAVRRVYPAKTRSSASSSGADRRRP